MTQQTPEDNKPLVAGWEIDTWPEWRAFAARLGIPVHKRWTDITINIPACNTATFSITCPGLDEHATNPTLD